MLGKEIKRKIKLSAIVSLNGHKVLSDYPINFDLWRFKILEDDMISVNKQNCYATFENENRMNFQNFDLCFSMSVKYFVKNHRLTDSSLARSYFFFFFLAPLFEVLALDGKSSL